MLANYRIVDTKMKQLGVSLMDSSAGLFAWVDFRKFLKVVSKEEELGKLER